MNKTITINLGGINFYIDEDAYHKLDKYLKAISTSLDPESREETLQDIEARIAELFIAKQEDQKEVIGLEAVDNIIAQMGQPEDYKMEEEADSTTTHQTFKSTKGLYRDIEHRTLAGVCAGLGHYLGISRILIRGIFLFLLFLPTFIDDDLFFAGSTIFLIYIVLWAVVPGARSTAQKLKMHGEKIDIDNIERKVREEFSQVKNKVENANYSGFRDFLEVLGKVLVGIIKIIAVIIGIFIVLVAGLGLLGLLLSFITLGAISFSGFSPIPDILGIYTKLPEWVAYLLTFLLTAIPLFLLILAGLKIIRPQAKSIGLTGVLVLAGIWILSLIPLAVYTPNWNYLNTTILSHSQTKPLHLSPQDTLYIQTYFNTNLPQQPSTLFRFEGETYSKAVDLKLIPSSDKSSLEIFKEMKVHSLESVSTHQLIYRNRYHQDTLYLDRVSSLYLKKRNISRQKINLSLHLPENTVFKIDKRLSSLIEGLKKEYYDHYLTYKNSELICLDCPAAATAPTKALNLPTDSSAQKNKQNLKFKSQNPSTVNDSTSK